MLFKKKTGRKDKSLSLFVHIPKTAGTSFREGIESISKVACDYTLNATITSKLIRKEVYENEDYYSFYLKAKKQNYQWISGHFNILKYLAFVEPRNIVSFVREPLDRTYSLFSHKVRHQDYKKEFDFFYNEKKFTNEQSRKLRGFPIELIGNLGITEKYEESMDLINGRYQIAVPVWSKNVNPSKHHPTQLHVSDQQKNDILTINKSDVDLYEKAVWLHNERVKLHACAKPWVHATVNLSKKGVITGLAWYAESDEAVVLEVYVNDNLIEQSVANLLYEGSLRTMFPRHGFVAYKFNPLGPQEKGKAVKVVVKKNDQVINFSPLTFI